MDTEKKVLTFSEACEYLGLKPSYAYKLTSAGTLPYSKPNGKKIYFEKEKLEQWMLSNPHPGSDERTVEAATYLTTEKRKGGKR